MLIDINFGTIFTSSTQNLVVLLQLGQIVKKLLGTVAFNQVSGNIT